MHSSLALARLQAGILLPGALDAAQHARSTEQRWEARKARHCNVMGVSSNQAQAPLVCSSNFFMVSASFASPGTGAEQTEHGGA